MELLKCRVCEHGASVSLGYIPDCGYFAGQPVSPPIKGGNLWVCKDCGSMFRHPTLSKSDYISLYEKAPGTFWAKGEEDRNDFKLIYKFLDNHTGGSILDVGCYSGNFLVGLSGKYEKFGVELSDSASKCARSKGIKVLGKTLADLDSNLVFDVVVLIDVIEHLLDVKEIMSQAISRVKENGLLIISTGNPGCYFWRQVYKSMFWYSIPAEHLTFPSFKYYNEFSVGNGLQPPQQICFRYFKINPGERFSRILRSAPLLLTPNLYHGLRKIYRYIKNNTTAITATYPVSLAGVFADHHLAIFRK